MTNLVLSQKGNKYVYLVTKTKLAETKKSTNYKEQVCRWLSRTKFVKKF